MKEKNIILFGAPGAGKGTHAGLIAEKYDLTHLSTGDLLRAETAAGTALGQEVKKIMEQGGLVDDRLVINLMDNAISRIQNGIVLDGFPRTVEQAQKLETLFMRYGRHLDGVISIDMPEEELVRRMRERALVQHRIDDNEETFRHRLEEYEKKTKPVLSYYSGTGRLISIDGSGEITETSARICQAIDMCMNV